MPTYEVQGPDGRTFEIEAPHPPTAAQAQSIFQRTSPAPQRTRAPGLATIGEMAGSFDADIASIRRGDRLADLPSERARTAAGARVMPSVGGLVGGIAGGIPGAAVGGAVGKAVEQAVLRGHGDPSVPSAPFDQAKAMATEGGVQGVLQGTGQVAAATAGRMAKWLMNRATTRVSAKLMRDFPELSDTLIDHALTVSKGGYEKALTLLHAAKAKANAALTRADQAGARVPVEFTPEVADSLRTALLETAVKSGKLPVLKNAPLSVATQRLTPDMKALFAQIDEAAPGGTFELSAKQADLLKTQLQKESRALYANRTAPNGQNALTTEATVKAEFASRLNDAIDAIADGYKAANAQAKPLIGATRGIQQATRPNGNLYQAMVRPMAGAIVGGGSGYVKDGSPAGAIAGAVAGGVMTTPSNMSRMAIGLGNPSVQEFLKQLPRPVYEAVISALESPAAGTR